MSHSNNMVGVAAGPLDVNTDTRLCRLTVCAPTFKHVAEVILTPQEVRELREWLEPFEGPLWTFQSSEQKGHQFQVLFKEGNVSCSAVGWFQCGNTMQWRYGHFRSRNLGDLCDRALSMWLTQQVGYGDDRPAA